MILARKNRSIQVMAVIVMSLMATAAMAQQQGRSEAHRAAFEECREQLGLEKPVAGERPVALEDSVREQLDACMKEKGFEPPKFGRRGGPHGGQGHRPAAADDGGTSTGVQ